MKLDEYELDYVKYFIQVKGYHQYEVLAEIMDHFILILEDKKEEHPHLSFEVLVDDAYETIGNQMFREINKAAKQKVRNRYNRLFLSHLMVFLHYKYVLIIAVAGLLIYQLQIWVQHVGNFLLMQSVTTILVYISIFRFSAVTNGNLKFMSTKITRQYGFYLVLAAIIIFGTLNRGILKPATLGFNMYFLLSTSIFIVMGIILYALVRTARLIVEESNEMEETYQVLK